MFAGCVGLWTLALTMGVGGSARQDVRMMFWSVITALVACIASGCLVAICAATTAVRQERLRVEDLATIMANAIAEDRDLPKIH